MLTEPTVRSGPPETILAELLAERSGLTVAPEMIPALVAGRIRQLGLDLESYASRVEADRLEHAVLADLLRPTAAERISVAEQEQDIVKRIIPWAAHRQRNLLRPTLRIWVVDDSDGAVAWSVAALLHRDVPEREIWELSILSTHPATEALIRSRVGRYSEARLATLNPELRSQMVTADGTVRRELRDCVHAAPLSLTEEWPIPPNLDLIICRQRLSRLPLAQGTAILGRMRKLLRPGGGSLHVGPEEDIATMDPCMRGLGHGIFVR